MKILALMLFVCPLWACQTQGPLERAGRNIDDAVEDVRDSAKDVIEDAREGAEDAGDDVRTRRRYYLSSF